MDIFKDRKFETACGFDVEGVFYDAGKLRGWVYNKELKQWRPRAWNAQTLKLSEFDGDEDIDGKTVAEWQLQERIPKKQISHTFFVRNDGICFFNRDNIDTRAIFAEVTVNVEVKEGDKITLTK